MKATHHHKNSAQPLNKSAKKKHQKNHKFVQPPIISPQSPSAYPLQLGNGELSDVTDSLYSAIAASAHNTSKPHHHPQHVGQQNTQKLSNKAKRKLKLQQLSLAPTTATNNSPASTTVTHPTTPTTTKIVRKALTNIAQFATAISTAPPSSQLHISPQQQQQSIPATPTNISRCNTPIVATSPQTTTTPNASQKSHNAIASTLSGQDLNQYVTKNLEKYELRIGQFNTLNLVKENELFYGNERYTADKVNRKVDWTSSQLAKMNCGIVGFQEVWHRETLLRCTSGSGLYRDEQVYTIDANGSGPTVALATIYPVLQIEAISDFPQSSLLEFSDENDPMATTSVVPVKKFSRPVLRAVLELPYQRIVTVFVVHAKSKRPLVSDSLRHDQKAKAIGHARSLVIRAAECAALRHLLVNEMETMKRPVIVIGDLNDNVHSVTTEIITGTIPWKKMSYAEKQKIWDVLLWSTNDVQVRKSDRDVNYSHIHNGRYEVLDHILVSQQFVRTYQNHIGYIMYQQLFNDHLIDETLKDEKRTNIESDHAQVVAVIKLESDLAIKRRKLRMVAEEM